MPRTYRYRHSQTLTCIPCLDGEHDRCKGEWRYKMSEGHEGARYICICKCPKPAPDGIRTGAPRKDRS